MLFKRFSFQQISISLAILSCLILIAIRPTTNALIFSSQIFVGIFIYVTCQVGKALYVFFRSDMGLANKWGLGICSFTSLAVVALDWPGYISIDDIYMLVELSLGHASGWHSVTYSILAQSFILLTGKTFFTFVFNFVLFNYLLVLIFSLNKWSWENPLFWFLLVILCLPQTNAVVFYQNRDSTYSLLLLIFLFSLFRKVGFWSLLPVVLVLGDMRQEGKIIVLLAPFLIALSQKVSWKVGLRYLALTGISAMVFYLGIIYIYDAPAYSLAYQATTYINPLNYIVHDKGLESLSLDEQKTVDKALDIQKLIIYRDPYDIYTFHEGGFRREVSEEDFGQFRKLAQNYILRNFPSYLESRYLISRVLFNVDRKFGIYEDSLRDSFEGKLLKAQEFFGFTTKGSFEGASYYVRVFLDRVLMQLPTPLHWFLASCLIPLLGLFFILFQFHRRPLWSAIAATLLLRTSIMVMLAPAAYFKYVASTWVAGWVLILLYIQIYYLNSRQEKKRS